MRRRTLPGLRGSFFLLIFASLPAIMMLACVKQPRRFLSTSGQVAPPSTQTEASLININTASLAELEKLPGIGKGLAARIIAYRVEYGRFRRVEHLMMVRGISTRRYQTMRALITAE
ncbi:MAG TPA: ComEA family DNA-binding protein [Pyrinomonadaceae bacterium]|nr:ComEA family DNA-binding protein [Pyrinomonadaceae bacterium]